jgi:hypothetical protein
LVYIKPSRLRKIEGEEPGGDNMLKNLMWQMFKNTGNIEYFMQYRDVADKKPDFMTEAGSETALDGEQWRISKPGEWSSGKSQPETMTKY